MDLARALGISATGFIGVRYARPAVVGATLIMASLGMTCNRGNTPSPADPVSTARSDGAPAASGRYIVTLRPLAGDTLRPTRAALESRLSREALQRSGGHVVDAVLVLHALVIDGVRDPEALRRDPNVVSVVLDLEHSPH